MKFFVLMILTILIFLKNFVEVEVEIFLQISIFETIVT